MKKIALLSIALAGLFALATIAAADSPFGYKTEPYHLVTQSTPTTNPITPPPILTFAPGSSYSLSGIITAKGKTAADVATPLSKIALGNSKQWSLQSDILAGIFLGGNANAGFDGTIRYDSILPLVRWSLFASVGFGEVIPLGAGNGPQFALTAAVGLSIPVK